MKLLLPSPGERITITKASMASIFMRSTSIAAALLCASIANAATPVAPTPAFKPIAPIAPPIANVITATPSNANISIVQAELAADKSIKVSVLASAPSSCDSMTLDIDGKQKVLTGIKFPLVDYLVPISDGIYPANKGAHTVTVSGASQYCKGSANTKFSNVESVPKIYGLTIAKAEVVDGQPLDLTVQGSGGACNYHLSIVNTDTQQEWKTHRTSQFPAFDKVSIDMPSPNYPHGNYKVAAKAGPNDSGVEKNCQGGSSELVFKKPRQAIHLAVDTPAIKEVQIQKSKKMDGIDRLRNDELLNFVVSGNVNNNDAQSADKRCAWRAEIVDGKGASKEIAKGTQFDVWQYGLSLSSFSQGSYTLKIGPNTNDASVKQTCLGSVAKKIDIFGTPGVITDLKLSSWGQFEVFDDRGALFIDIKIAGSACNYKVTQRVDNGKTTTSNQYFHASNRPDKIPYTNYLNDETLVEVTVEGVSTGNYFEGGSCEGILKKSITVYDKPQKKGAVH